MARNETKFTALYERLSRDDELQGVSNSIINQKKYLEDYAHQNGFRNLRHFTDDGYTGINFNRPAMTELLAEVEAGHVGAIIVKDMSRFGRNYLQVGFYTEMLFPDKGVRFIAINNGIDSANPSENDFAPFLNIMNEWYAKDTSNKIRAVFHSRMLDGKRCSGSIPYGYYRKPDDKQTLYVDPESAAVVLRIFEMAAEGKGVKQIGDILHDEKVLNPSSYNELHYPENCRHHGSIDPYFWAPSSVTYILDRQEYLGHTVLGKSILENFKTKKRRKATPEELIIIPDTHEAIITQELWDKAQRLRVRKPRKLRCGDYTHRLSGLIYCADCGRKLAYHSPKNIERTSGKTYDSDEFFACSGTGARGSSCTHHYIKASTLELSILKAVQAVSKYVIENESEFVEQLKTQWESQQEAITLDERKELKTAESRLADLDILIRNIYENFALGKLPERQYQRLMTEYDSEQQTLEARVQELKALKGKDRGKKIQTDRFIALVHRYKNITELTTPMLYEFIEKVVVYEPTGGRYHREIKLDIYFNFIGKYVPPVTEEETKAAEKAEKKQKAVKEKRKKEAVDRAGKKRQQNWREIKEAAKTDPEAARLYEEHLAQYREWNHRYKAQCEARAAVDPEFAEHQRQLAKARSDRQSAKKKAQRAALKAQAQEDPAAAQEYQELLAAEAAHRAEQKASEEARAAVSPEYAEELHAKKLARSRKHSDERKAALADLKERAMTDPAAAEELAEFRAHRDAIVYRSRQRRKEKTDADSEIVIESDIAAVPGGDCTDPVDHDIPDQLLVCHPESDSGADVLGGDPKLLDAAV